MEYKRIEEVNGLLKPIPLETKKGVSYYVPVNEQVKGFRMLEPNGKIETAMQMLDDITVCFRAMVYAGNGDLLATGTAYEVKGSTFINKTSYIENCETSAIGRALSFCGIGIEQSIASYEEVANAKLNQDDPPQEQQKKQQKPPQKVSRKPVEPKQPEEDAGQLIKELLVIGARKGYGKEDIKRICKEDDLTTLSVERIKKGIDFMKEIEPKGENENVSE